MPAWRFVEQKPSTAIWQDATGDVVTLTWTSTFQSMPPLSDVASLRGWCRRIAESQRAGLVEVVLAEGVHGPALTYIYKRLQIPAFTFYGVVLTPIADATWIWMIIASEHGLTGVREASVTARRAEAGQLTIASYESSWAQDPYDPSYRGVDRSTLRYASDSEEYDHEFPHHPLTKVRRELRRLLTVDLSPTPAA